MSETVLGHFHNEWDLPASLDPPPVKVLLNISTAVPKLNPSTCLFPFAIAFLFFFFFSVFVTNQTPFRFLKTVKL